MNIDSVMQAILLLTVYFNRQEVSAVKPLSPLEYGRFAQWLHQQGYTPADLLSRGDEVLASWSDPKDKITAERIRSLLGRGASMGFAMEQWQAQGVWVLSRAQSDYPRGIHEHLKGARPAILFGIGNQQLLNHPAIGFVGSRSIDMADEQFANVMARKAVELNYAVVSGGAKGVDQAAVASAIKAGGCGIAVVADSLLKAATSKLHREAIQNEQLVLLSPFYPEAGFSAGNAMARNKYIYTLSQAVVVVKSDLKKGGTWSGADENLKKGWVPLLVRNSAHAGNQGLIQQGGFAIDESFDFAKIPELASTARAGGNIEPAADLFSQPPVAGAGVEANVDVDLEPVNEVAQAVSGEVVSVSELSPSNVEESVGESTEEHVADKNESAAAAPAASKPIALGMISNESDVAFTEMALQAEQIIAAGVPLEKQAEASAEVVNPAVITPASPLNEPSAADDIVDLSVTELADYGAVFAAFYRGVVAQIKQHKVITPAEINQLFPELPLKVIADWLKKLEQVGAVRRVGKKVCYSLPEQQLL